VNGEIQAEETGARAISASGGANDSVAGCAESSRVEELLDFLVPGAIAGQVGIPEQMGRCEPEKAFRRLVFSITP